MCMGERINVPATGSSNGRCKKGSCPYVCVCVCVCVRVRVCMRACVRVHGHEELWDAWELLIKADEGMRERWSLLYFLYGRLCASAENGAVHL